MEMNSVSETLADLNQLAPLSAHDFIDYFYCGSSRHAWWKDLFSQLGHVTTVGLLLMSKMHTFDDLTVANIGFTISWDVTLFSSVDRYGRFEANYYLHIQDRKWCHVPEDLGSSP
jgi:hypothetical protein